MLSKAQIKHLQGLKLKKYRQNYGDFLIEGDKLITEALLEKVYPELIIATSDWIQQHSGNIPEGIPIAETEQSVIEKISSLSTPPPVMALMQQPKQPTNPGICKGQWWLALDGINDPGNMGTLLRTADWFGIRTILCSENCVDLYNPKVIQSTMGALFRVQVYYGDLSSWLAEQKVNSYAAVLGGEPLTETHFHNEGILVIGSESHGISEPVLEVCNQTVTIPHIGKTESLNAAIAGSILLYEIRRQHQTH